jgi:signal transduction histidine kinase
MKRSAPLEPGVISIFRLFTGVRLVVVALAIVFQWFGAGRAHGESYEVLLFSIVEIALLFVYLSLPGLQRSLKGLYLPIGVVWAAAGPILLSFVGLQLAGNLVTDAFMRLVLWQLIPVLFIPLVIVAWQYTLRAVLLFCLLTAALEIWLFIWLMPRPFAVPPLLATIMTQTITFSLVGYMITKLMKVQREQRQHLTEANQRLAQYASTLEQLTISRERNRMARELHDVLAHTLSGVAVELEGLRAVINVDPERSQALLNHSLQAIREGLSETRRALQELRAQPLEDLGLAFAVRALAEAVAGRAGFQLELEIDDDLGDFTPSEQQAIYRIAQEALTNVAEHAQASRVQVRLHQNGSRLALEIVDDGRGFDPDQPSSEYQYGLLGIRERVDMMGGSLSVESQPGEGTKIAFIMEGTNPKVS